MAGMLCLTEFLIDYHFKSGGCLEKRFEGGLGITEKYWCFNRTSIIAHANQIRHIPTLYSCTSSYIH